MSAEQIVVVNAALAIAVPNGAEVDACVADAVNEILREQQRSYAPDSCLLDYRIGSDIIPAPQISAAAYGEGDASKALAQAIDPTNPAVDLIKFIVESRVDEVEALLACWCEGNFDAIRREWPECPDSIFEGLESPEMRARSEAQAKAYHERKRAREANH